MKVRVTCKAEIPMLNAVLAGPDFMSDGTEQ